ncbi:membrane glycoprotein polyprotein [Mermet virus]|uniref:Envelopment polyprotein n=1 Tax=Mermet virus TaxID=159147 RepID=A0A023VZC8_9VIRU|nr:membrane glycoprotein polyprotein [Mermet virus]AHY22344.1 membrane glycoprotein polyprotein [Mermet virus]
MIFILQILAVVALAIAHPLTKYQIGERCFAGGAMLKDVNQTTGVGEVCVKDDISMIKSIVIPRREGSGSMNWIRFYRVYIVKEWHDCNPVTDRKGNFMILDVTEAGTLIPRMYMCRANCDITLDRDNAEIVFTSQKTNHYEVSGTTVVNGWFKQAISVSLEHTCEHLTATCGQKTLKFHACFRQHRSCVRYFKNSYIPYRMIESMCQNLELLIMLVFTFVAFAFSMIITRTYIAYLMIPLFYPPAYIYGKIYNKYFKMCKNCNLAVHPFSNCGNICICGSRFTCTEQVKVHRLCGGCPGYKSLSKARSMCKSKTWSFISAILAGIFLFSFITPINADERLYKLDELADDFIELSNEVNRINARKLICKIVSSVILGFIAALLISEKYIFNKLFNRFYRNCSICGMIHYRPGLTFNSSVTNRCGTCICGYTEQQSTGEDYEIFIKDMHKQRESCKYVSVRNHYRNIKVIIIFLLITAQIVTASSDEKECLKYPFIIQKSNLTRCFGHFINFTDCNKLGKTGLFTSLKSENLVTDIDKSDFNILDYKSDTAFEKIEMAQDLHKMILLEYIYFKENCDALNTMKGNSGPFNMAWRSYIKTHHLDACGQYPHKIICRCISSHQYCHNADADAMDELKTYYTTHQAAYTMDFETVIETIALAFRGIGKVLIENFVAENLTTEIDVLLNNIESTLTANLQLKGIVKFAKMMRKISVIRPTRYQRSSVFSITAEPELAGTQFSDYSVHTEDITICKEPHSMMCYSKRQRTSQNNFLLCKINSQWKVFKWPEKPTINTDSGLCYGDKHCNLKFPRLDADAAIKQISCFKSSFAENPSGMDEQLKKCTATAVGDCTTISGHLWPVVHCKNDKYYHSDTKEHAKDGIINSYCLSEKCKIDKLPIHKSWFKSCNWDSTIKENLGIKEFVHLDIESYKKAIESDIKTDLVLHHFRLTKNLPHTIPKYKALTVQGTDYQDGIQNAYITGTLPAISGLAAGYHLRAPDGQELFDIILFLKKAVYKARYTKIYSTGPTISINVQHNEKCTGTCPREIPKQEGWLTFSKEHTSNWGCEEFGCLAIDSGCLYGSCQDVIRPEMDVFKKQGAELTLIEICISTPHETMCNDLDILEPLIGDKIEVSFQTTQSVHMPTLIGVKKGSIYTGQINDLGNTAEICGSVQMINGSLIGQGTPKFDYICHAAKRKDVVVRRCYNNHYIGCNLLEKRNDILHSIQGSDLSATLSGNNLGLMNFRIALGDINYKAFIKDTNFEIKGSCAGCIGCSEEIICELNIVTQGEILCPIASQCDLYINSILLKPETEKYAIKMSCKKASESVEITICKKKSVYGLTLKPHQQKIDLSKLDESNFIKEEDLRCGTWLCKVKDEGLGFIFENILNKIGRIWTIVIYCVIGILFILMTIYLIYPCCKRLRGILERNEIEFLAEQKMK